MLDPDSSSPIVILLVLLVLHALFAAAKEALASLRKSRRIQFIEEGRHSAQIVDDLAEDATRLLATEQLTLKFLGFFIVAVAVFVYALPLADALSIPAFLAVSIITVISVFVVLLFGELIPKEVARNYADPLAFWLVRPFKWVSYLATPLARFVVLIGRFLTMGHTEDDSFAAITEDDLRTYVDASEEDGVLREEEKEMIYSIFDLDDTLSREVMVPRIDIVAVEADQPLTDAMNKIIEAGHSRAPVYLNSLDNIIGVVYVKDLVQHLLKEGDTPRVVRGLEREVYYVPESKPVSDLLRELQRKKVHIAVVIDEYGGTAGLVTIEDVLEEIVGEIQDEHDTDEFYMQHVSDDEYIFSARMDLDDINDEMDINLPTDESDTLAGLVYNGLGRIPKPGDSLNGSVFNAPELRLTVLAVDGRRIKTVKIERLKKDRGQDGRHTDSSDAGTSSIMGKTQKPVSNSS